MLFERRRRRTAAASENGRARVVTYQIKIYVVCALNVCRSSICLFFLRLLLSNCRAIRYQMDLFIARCGVFTGYTLTIKYKLQINCFTHPFCYKDISFYVSVLNFNLLIFILYYRLYWRHFIRVIKLDSLQLIKLYSWRSLFAKLARMLSFWQT